MGRRRICCKVEIESNRSHETKLFDAIEERLAEHPKMKAVLHAPSAKQAESTLKEAWGHVLGQVGTARKQGIRSVVTDESLTMRHDMMEAFFKSLNKPHGSGEVQIVIGTNAIDCGISGNHCRTAMRDGPPASLVQIVQQMGRVTRCHQPETVNDLCCVVLCCRFRVSSK
jgi:hypothetical protein